MKELNIYGKMLSMYINFIFIDKNKIKIKLVKLIRIDDFN
jgi:hypothetical protein